MIKSVLISGIQPTGRLHLGNYLGALRHFVALQNSGKYRCYFFIADLHSLTEPFSQKEKSRQVLELAADFLAAGIDSKKSILFLQSDIPEHGELAFILNTLTPMGELQRMTQFKDKMPSVIHVNNEDFKKYQGSTKEALSVLEKGTSVGLFTYPTLMAADILLYDAKFVPVGEDQLQHLELARELAKKFNSRFGKTFIEPQPLLTETPRVMSLDNPRKKMSKSSPKGCLFLDDSPRIATEKIMRAVTDSGADIVYEPDEKPAIANLLRIYAALSRKLIPDIEREFKGAGYAEFKKSLAGAIAKHFAEYRKKKAVLVKNPLALKRVLAQGGKITKKVAEKKIDETRSKLGIKP